MKSDSSDVRAHALKPYSTVANYLLGLILLSVEMIVESFLTLCRHERIQLSLGEVLLPKEFPGHISALSEI